MQKAYTSIIKLDFLFSGKFKSFLLQLTKMEVILNPCTHPIVVGNEGCINVSGILLFVIRIEEEELSDINSLNSSNWIFSNNICNYNRPEDSKR